MFVRPEQIAEIVRLGNLRAPNEACGMLLTRWESLYVTEIPNTADEPQSNTYMTADDMNEAMRRLVRDPARYPGNLTRELVVWHTHPSGLVGPSRPDMRFRKTLGSTRCLVVTLPGGEAVQF